MCETENQNRILERRVWSRGGSSYLKGGGSNFPINLCFSEKLVSEERVQGNPFFKNLQFLSAQNRKLLIKYVNYCFRTLLKNFDSAILDKKNLDLLFDPPG